MPCTVLSKFEAAWSENDSNHPYYSLYDYSNSMISCYDESSLNLKAERILLCMTFLYTIIPKTRNSQFFPLANPSVHGFYLSLSYSSQIYIVI
jgi:hypothetical protein